MTAAYTPKGITRKELLRLKRRAFLGFYLRPKIMVRMVLAIRSYRHLRFLLRRIYRWVLMKPNPAHGVIEERRAWRSGFRARLAGLFGCEPAPAAD